MRNHCDCFPLQEDFKMGKKLAQGGFGEDIRAYACLSPVYLLHLSAHWLITLSIRKQCI